MRASTVEALCLLSHQLFLQLDELDVSGNEINATVRLCLQVSRGCEPICVHVCLVCIGRV